jgi:hypothetical protein
VCELSTPVAPDNHAYRDPAWVAFGKEDVGITEKWIDTPTLGSKVDDPQESLAGYLLDQE